ncbi:MAG: phosphate ABC transporter permease PstA [Desulfomonilia bacterium]|jgi:phosphate transport system permease protein|uniref:Phosphate transport system permease protein PstA n=1 Tax=anaerobic digester metagenome TaxID=1263854 RepID=A0A485LTV6_9ZZZZ|nr:phosphate ABC transporter permease PstA [Pseudomonadota bacterium]HON39777.1 phosphate ABC transporter permease PstA [Deltaproteobacteria bacterium]HPX19527.1 phosphate ABC transporter permease PstA [Deltaproteobacteria bacterium]HRV36399.1 phosphate ABC transporter permease PstA [Desulfomonilia bacterium]
MNVRPEHALTFFSWLAAGIVMTAVFILIGYLLIKGLPIMSPALFFGDTPWRAAVMGIEPVFDGIYPAVAGTFILIACSSFIAIPVGVFCGIYLAEYARGPLKNIFSFMVDLLSGMPSIVMGLFGFALILLMRRTLYAQANTSILLSSACIALLILPYLIRMTQVALESLPESTRLLGPSLGYTRWQNIWHVLLPASSTATFSGIILSIGRAAEDTAVIMLTGVVANAGIPRALSDKFEALPFSIFYLTAEHRDELELQRAFGSALVLLTLTATLFLISYCIQRRFKRRWELGE